MIKLDLYQNNYETFNVRDSFTNGDKTIHILKIFKLYGDTYVSYVFESEPQLYTDLVDKFITLKSNYPTRIINNKLTNEFLCSHKNNE